jgi:maltodextrin utilization protein YvdJ
MNTSFKAANAATDRVAINTIVDEAANATADQVAVNATIVNVAAHTVTGQVAAISDEAERGA